MDNSTYQDFEVASAYRPQSPTSLQSPINNYGSSIITLTNPEDQLYRMELTLRNMIADSNGKPQSYGTPLLNEIGIRSVVGQTQSIVSQITIMSNLDDKHIVALIDFLGDTLAKDLMLNRTRYEIANPSVRDRIYFTCLTNAFICMRRAFEEGDKRFWKGSVQEIKTTVDSQKGGGFLSALGWKK
jgi:hypothetical protein